MTVARVEVRRKQSGEGVVRRNSSGHGGQRKRSEGGDGGRYTRRGGSSLSVFPLAGGFRPEKQPQGVGVGECGEGDGLALGLRPGSFYSSQN